MIAAARARYGDTFVVKSGAEHYLFTFSRTGVESFYALTKETANQEPPYSRNVFDSAPLVAAIHASS